MALIKCCYCRSNIQPVDGQWSAVGLANGDPDHCKHAPDGVHARQRVVNVQTKSA